MPKIYETKAVQDGDQTDYLVLVKRPDGTIVEEPVSKELYEELRSLQRELWRLDKREQRHCVHLDAIPEFYHPRNCKTADPESALIESCLVQEIWNAFGQLPIKQQRRAALRFICDLPIAQIAALESCSERAIKYSLKLAKRNLLDILGDDFMRPS